MRLDAPPPAALMFAPAAVKCRDTACVIEHRFNQLAWLAGDCLVAVDVSTTTLYAKLMRLLEPRTEASQHRSVVFKPSARRRAGVPVGVSVSPVIPFLNEPELERMFGPARDAGAGSAFSIVLRLRGDPLCQQWLDRHMPIAHHGPRAGDARRALF